MQHDKISTFIEMRYVGASEAAWLISPKPLPDKSHTVERLPVDLSNEQSIPIRTDSDHAYIETVADQQGC